MQFWQAEVVVLQIENFTFFNARESPVEFLSSGHAKILQGNLPLRKSLWHSCLHIWKGRAADSDIARSSI